MKENALIVFTRLPIAGQTKTRLMPYFSGEECAAFHRELLANLAPLLKDMAADTDIYVFYTPAGPEKEVAGLKKLLGPACYLPQQGESLGLRMEQAFAEVLGRGYTACLLMGTDIPLLTAADIRAAGDLLSNHEVVLCPTEDGGYWLIGLKQPCPPLFAEQPYGTTKALKSAADVCVRYNLSLALGPQKRDIDTEEDLAALWPEETGPLIRAKPNLAAVITAGGMSSRMGSFKPLLPLAGSTIIKTALHTLRKFGVMRIIIVSGNRSEELRQHLQDEVVDLIFNPHYSSGDMFASACLGLKAALNVCEQLFFLPVDTPLFHISSLQAMYCHQQKTACQIVIPAYQGKHGHPILLQSSAIAPLLAYQGENGLRGAIHSCDCHTEILELTDLALVMDADTPVEYQLLCQYAKQQCLNKNC